MKLEYKKLQRMSMSALILFFVLIGAMSIDIVIIYLKWPSYLKIGAPDATALRHAVFYIPCILAAIITHTVLRRKLLKDYPDRFPAKVRPTKKNTIRRVVKSIVITLLMGILLMMVTPYIALPIFLNRHVNYLGYTTPKHVLQDIYEASEYDIKETQRYLITEDGFKVWTSEIYTEQPKAVIIYLTGIMQPSVTYFYGHAKYMQERGYASILLEVRGHGKSDGNRICLGYEEVNDVRAVVEFIKAEKKYDGVPIVIQGMSMGGAVSINAFGQISEIDALIAMSAYSSFEEVAIDQMNGLGIPKIIQRMEKPFLRSALKVIYGKYAVENLKPIEQIKNTNGRPALLIACTGDMEVPPINMQRLSNANPVVQTWLRDSWEHFIVKDCNLMEVAQDKEYCDRILIFLEDEVIKD